jgi:hypothetical protein
MSKFLQKNYRNKIFHQKLKMTSFSSQVAFFEIEFKIPKGFRILDIYFCPFSKTKSLFEFDNFQFIYISQF